MTTGGHASTGHAAILASAGSGKTTRLTHRYIQLLAGKDFAVAPGRICALTFTRKAAGQIFDRIVQSLCQGAADRGSAAELARSIGRPDLDQRACGRLLKNFLEQMHRAVIGTMDSFIFGVARSFPIELGIPMDFSVADTDKAEGKAMRREILADILSGPDGRGGAGFLEAFKRATFGAEEKGAEELLDRIMSGLHMAYRFCPARERWGGANLIWGDGGGPAPVMADMPDLERHARKVLGWVEGRGREPGVNQQFLEGLRSLVESLARHGMTAPWSEAFNGKVFDQLLLKRTALRRGGVVFTYRSKDIRLPDDVAVSLAALADNLVAVEIRRAVEKTMGLYDLLAAYDRAYERTSRESGRFSFTDIQYLLALGDISRGAPAISRCSGPNRLFIDYRMDATLDHWLIDEFQDTSDLQWAIFRNLISELIQGDPAGRERSFFYVGDVKQSVYRWRGGNPGLFLGILDYYNRAGEVIRLETMSSTHRCSLPVVETVNRVFSSLPAERLAGNAAAEWGKVWRDHETSNVAAKGYAVLLQHGPVEETSERALANERYRLVADLLNEVKPAQRNICVGVLVRDNKACSELVNVLRGRCPRTVFVHEGKAGITENELAQAILALVRLAAHPGDLFARQYVLMSPMALALEKLGIGSGGLPVRLLAEIMAGGFQAFVAEWGLRLARAAGINEYGRQCLARLEDAAAVFDASNPRCCDRFLQFINDYEVHEEAGLGSVRIMTIHQAKGLEFDMVVLPQLQHRNKMSLAGADWQDKEFLSRGDPLDPDWVIKTPHADIAASDPVLREQLQAVDARSSFDALCLLYVAMTRARHALYMIVSPEGRRDAFRPSSLLKLQLAGDTEIVDPPGTTVNGRTCEVLYEAPSGDRQWYQSFKPQPMREKEAVDLMPGAAKLAGRKSSRVILQRSEPSRQETIERPASALFDPETRDVLDFGSAIHELFEKIGWLDDNSDPDALAAGWTPSLPWAEKVIADARVQFRRCLGAPEVRRALARPDGRAELWREKSFELILDGRWVSGVFDRVVVRMDANGRPEGAEITDFKSNRGLVTGEDMARTAGFYRPQMELYRRALSVILGLEEDRISAQLLFTVPARVFRLWPPA